MAWPTFLIIGASKSATTTIHALLDQHPDVYMTTPKEPSYWALAAGTRYTKHWSIPPESRAYTSEAYQRLFEEGASHLARGESSTTYITTREAASLIREHLPGVRIMVVLRHPVERAFSAYMHLVRDGLEKERDFGRALDLETERIRQGYTNIWHYIQCGYYSQQLEVYYAHFPAEQIRVFLYDDFVNDPQRTLQAMYRHIGVSDDFTPEFKERRNVSGQPRNRWLMTHLRKPSVWKNVIKGTMEHIFPRVWFARVREYCMSRLMTKQEVPRDQASRLSRIYQEDMSALEKLLGRDLTEWKQRYE